MMTKKRIAALELILSKLLRGQAYLLYPTVVVCQTKDIKTTTVDYINDKGDVITSVDKEIGSELALLHRGISDLLKFITNLKG